MTTAAYLAIFLSSCAIHPLPENVTGLSTDKIVAQIRCETRSAARDMVLDEIQLPGQQRARLHSS
jgi:hypothetical protein